jgi:hypothetical protein
VSRRDILTAHNPNNSIAFAPGGRPMRFWLVLVVTAASCAFAARAHATPALFASTNQSELVHIDLGAGTATLVGQATGQAGWTDVALSPDGTLYAVSRFSGEPSSDA